MYTQLNGRDGTGAQQGWADSTFSQTEHCLSQVVLCYVQTNKTNLHILGASTCEMNIIQ